ncbi:MAG: SEC-C domain-containing protein, partial [Firmicutes bacterium]|nr:SEC-C domain-containing protein [Bacillota bacterium]
TQPQAIPFANAPAAQPAQPAPSAEKMLRGQMPKEAPKEIRTASHTPVVRKDVKVGRNDPCPCGSGKKYKNCCGRNQND